MPQQESRVTLFDIRMGLYALMELDISGFSVTEMLDYDAAVSEVVKAEIKKVDGIAAILFNLGLVAARAMAESERHLAEADRLRERMARATAAADRLRKHVTAVMLATVAKPEHGPRRLEGEAATLKVCSIASKVEILSEQHIPADFLRSKTITITEPDKVSILVALRGGKEVPGCRLLDNRYRLVVE